MAKSAGVQFPDLPPQLQEAVASGRMDEATARQRALANRPQYRAALGLPAQAGGLQAGGEDQLRAARERIGGSLNAAVEGAQGAFPAGDTRMAELRRRYEATAGGGDPSDRMARMDGGGLGSPFVRMAVPSGGAPTPYSPGGLPAGGMKPQGPGMPEIAGKSPGMMPPASLDGGMAKPKPQISDLAELAGGPPRPRASMSGGGLQEAGAAIGPTPPTDPKPQLSDLASATAGGFRSDPAAENRRRMMEQRRTAGAALGQKGY